VERRSKPAGSAVRDSDHDGPGEAIGSIAIGDSIVPAVEASPSSAGFAPAAMRRNCPQAASILAPFRRRT
jgi:hypothetical protein